MKGQPGFDAQRMTKGCLAQSRDPCEAVCEGWPLELRLWSVGNKGGQKFAAVILALLMLGGIREPSRKV